MLFEKLFLKKSKLLVGLFTFAIRIAENCFLTSFSIDPKTKTLEIICFQALRLRLRQRSVEIHDSSNLQRSPRAVRLFDLQATTQNQTKQEFSRYPNP